MLAFAAVQIEKKQYDKILSYIEHGKREGAILLTGGKPLGEKGYYIEPTIFTDVKVSTFYSSTVACILFYDDKYLVEFVCQLGLHFFCLHRMI